MRYNAQRGEEQGASGAGAGWSKGRRYRHRDATQRGASVSKDVAGKAGLGCGAARTLNVLTSVLCAAGTDDDVLGPLLAASVARLPPALAWACPFMGPFGSTSLTSSSVAWTQEVEE